MPSLRSLLLASLNLTTLVLSQPAPLATQPRAPAVDVTLDFQELLNALPEESIHAALHKHLDTKYQDGVWEHDRSAIEAVHNEDPPTATRLLVGAALDLIKRQAGGNGTTTVTQQTSSTVSSTSVATATSTSSQPAAVVVPVEVSSTNSAGSVVVETTSAVVGTASVSVVSAVTTTNSAGSTVVQSTTLAGALVTADGKVSTSPVSQFVAANPTAKVDVTTTNSAGNTVILNDVTSGQVVTGTDGAGSTFVTTFTPTAGMVKSLVLETTTLPNGQASVITSYADVALMTAAASGGASTTNSPKLQNDGESVRSRAFGAEAIALVGGVIAIAVLL